MSTRYEIIPVSGHDVALGNSRWYRAKDDEQIYSSYQAFAKLLQPLKGILIEPLEYLAEHSYGQKKMPIVLQHRLGQIAELFSFLFQEETPIEETSPRLNSSVARAIINGARDPLLEAINQYVIPENRSRFDLVIYYINHIFDKEAPFTDIHPETLDYITDKLEWAKNNQNRIRRADVPKKETTRFMPR